MIDEIVISNYLSSTITMGRDNQDFLIDDDGLDWGTVKNTVSTTKATNNYEFISMSVSLAEPRPISIVGWIIGTEQQISEKKLTLSRFFSSNSHFQIRAYENLIMYYIDVYIADNVEFGNTISTNNEVMCRFKITLNALCPYFCRDRSYNFLSSQQKEIENLGCLASDGYILLTLEEAVTDPYLVVAQGLKQSTSYFVGEFLSGDTIAIDTRQGNRGVYKNSVKNMGIWRVDSSWFRVPVSLPNSPNTITTSFSCSAQVIYKELYTNIGGV